MIGNMYRTMYRDGTCSLFTGGDLLTRPLPGTIFYIIMLAASIANMCFMFVLPVRLSRFTILESDIDGSRDWRPQKAMSSALQL